MVKPKMIIANHGYAEIAPENTQLAFDAAYLFGFDGVQITIDQSKDEKLVVVDQLSLDHISKNTKKINDMTLKELEKINLSAYFNKFFPKQIILTYKEFLKLYGKVFKIINVQIKNNIANIEEKILDAARELRPKAEIIYCSNNLEILKNFYKLDYQSKLGFIFESKDDLKPIITEVKKICQYLHPWFNSLNDLSDLSYYQKLKIPLNVWTFDRRNNNDYWTKNSHKIIAKLKVMPEIACLISNSKF